MTDSPVGVRVYLTGGVRIECNGDLLDHRAFSWPHSQLVLAYMISERNRPLSFEEIANAIWETKRPDDWEIAVPFVVQQLRNTLANSPADKCLRIKGVENPELSTSGEVWVDTEAAAEAIHDAEGQMRAGNPAEAFGPSAVAHHIAKRPFLRDEQSAWVQGHRDRLRGILVRALECRAEFYLWNREFPLAIEAAKEVLSIEPFREPSHRLLIRAHVAAGNAAEAKLAFEHCRRLLADKLGIEPSLETREAYQSKVRSVEGSPVPMTTGKRGEPLPVSGTTLHKDLQRLLGDSYDIKEELPAGGMSRVFLAEERALGRQVVVKVLPPDMAEIVSAERFTREVKFAAKLQQANIVPVLTAAVVGGLPYYTMPFIPGNSLRQAIVAQGLPVMRATAILRDVARALAFAHEHGVVHRDIKPENILLSGDTAVVTDFGIAKALKTAEDARGEHLTGTGMALGTPQYMAPEQIAGDPNIDHRADVYSFGVVAYELLTGSSPFGGRGTREVLVGHLIEQPSDLRRERRDVPRSLADIITRCLEKEPDKRPQTMNVVLDALDQ